MSNVAKVKIGDKFNRLTIIEDLGFYLKEGTKDKAHYVKCKCDCGNEIIVQEYNLKSGHTKSCGECARKLNNYYIVGNVTYVQYNNSYDCFIIDTEDLDKIKNYRIFCTERGYPEICFGGGKYARLSRFIMNCPNDMVVDHINHKTWDNRKNNLQICTISENSKKKKRCTTNKSGFKGIYFDFNRKKWVSTIYYDKKQESQRFSKFIDAYSWYVDKAKATHREFMYNPLCDKRLNLRYAKAEHFDIQNGTGIGYTLFVQGCNNHCDGCFNKQTWDFNGGKEYTQDVFNEMIEMFNKFPQVKRLTLCGGEPLQNLELSNFVAAEFKRLFPDRKLWIYTGLSFEDIKDDIKYKAILELCDVLVDGKFVEEQKDLTLRWCGSDNQRVIDLPKTLKEGEVVLYEK